MRYKQKYAGSRQRAIKYTRLQRWYQQKMINWFNILSVVFYQELNFIVGNAENLTSEKDASYDAYTISFGIRNCTHLDKVIKEAYRVLKPGSL
jgi:ubiquinone/menaquinone biosynthesis C-methylase UbiE